jgi:hypothetical protein
MKQCLKTDEVVELPIRNCPWLPKETLPPTRVFLRRTRTSLKLRFLVREQHPQVTFHQMNDPVYRDSCVEFFVQPLGEPGTPYLNFELNAAGTLLLGKGLGRENRELLTPEAASPLVIRPGSCTDPFGDAWWDMLLEIPFSWLEAQVSGFKAETGAVLRMNLYKCGEDTPVPHYGSWNPMTSPKPDFHRPEDFGLLAFV